MPKAVLASATVALLGGVVALAVATARLAVSLRAFFSANGELRTPTGPRRYLLHLPPGLDPARPVPLVVVIHGFMQSPAQQQSMSHWDQLADTEGFITVYPMGAGFPLRWPTHDPMASSASTREQVDFITGLIAHLRSGHNIDPQRIFASGMSNGGGLAMVLACELPQLFAAVGSVAGLYTYPASGSSARPVPLIAFHGELDRIVPIEGGVERLGHPLPAVADWIAAYASACGCSETSQATVSPHVLRTCYTGPRPDQCVIWYRLSEGGHTWPGGEPLPEAITGPTAASPDATRLTWEFFQAHPLPPTEPGVAG